MEMPVGGESSKKYNCHGFAWHMHNRYPTDSVCIFKLQQNINIPYVLDESYEQVNEANADIVVMGNYGHSAVKLNNGDYISKWGLGPVFIHSLYEVMNYYGSDTLFFKRTTPVINGSSYPCGYSTYYVSKINPNSTVTWSLPYAPSLSYLLTQNSPQTNQCTFYNNGSTFDTYLVATITDTEGTRTVSKRISSSYDITFSQIGRTYNGYTYPDIPETSIENNSTIAVSQMCNVYITSPVFSNMTLTHTGATLSSWAQTGNTLRLSFPYNTSLPRPTAYISGTDGCRSVNLTVVSYYGTTPIPTLQITPVSGGFEASLVYPSEDGEGSEQANRLSATVEWDLEVHHATSAEKVLGKHIVGACETINTSGWKSGIYIVTAKVDGQILTQKVTVK